MGADLSGITDDMIQRTADEIAAIDGYPSATGMTAARQAHYEDQARRVLSAALAGCTVVHLPEPDGTDETGTWWNHDHGAVIADEFSTIDTSQIMRRRAAALLAAADHIERRTARVWRVGDPR